MDEATVHAALRWFPLTGHARPACPPLPDRVREITQLVESAREPGANVLSKASHALNKAALLASDCGHPGLARDLCWQHINAYLNIERPFTVQEARGVLGPALNLARLSLRADDPVTALQLLDDIYQAVMNGTNATIDGQPLPLAGLTGTRANLRQLREDVWLQYLAESIRAHARLGQWDQAVNHAEAHHGIGAHLMDGRQTAIIAQVVNGHRDEAQRLLAESAITQPWEQHVASCLGVMCAEDNDVGTAIDAMTALFLESAPAPGYTVFRTRLALTIATLSASASSPQSALVATKTANEVIESADAYAARDFLSHQPPGCLPTEAQSEKLTALVNASALNAGSVPKPLQEILRATASSSASLIRNLSHRTRPPAAAELGVH